MASLNMTGTFKLNSEEIDREITQKLPGNYALGYMDGNIFTVQYVGRSDNDLYKRLKDHIGESYEYFKYSYATSPRDAFLKECKNYHDFGEKEKLDNRNHPQKPENANWICPVCNN